MSRMFAVAGLALFALVAQAEDFREGVDYSKLPVAVSTASSDVVEVVEVFSYACPHCNEFDPLLERWRADQPDDVAFSRVPAVFNETYAALARAFFTAEALGVSEQVHTPIFHAIHARGVDLRRTELMASLFEEMAGVAPDEFAEVYDSFGVRGKVQQADALARAYRITGVPALIVDGRYRVDARTAGGYERMLAVVDHLVAEQRKSKGATPATAQAAQ